VKFWGLAIVLAAAGTINVAVAADKPANWSGWYAGIEAGGDWGRFSQTNTISGVSLGFFNQDGGSVGGTFGYNWQSGPWVLGAETDLSWTNLSGTQACGPALTFVCTTEMRSFGTVRGRAGVSVLSNVLAYATGGLAYGDISATRNVGATKSDDWRTTWTIGGGIEVMLLTRWSAKIEYLYSSFPGTSTTYIVTASATPVAAAERNVQVVRVGLNYHF